MPSVSVRVGAACNCLTAACCRAKFFRETESSGAKPRACLSTRRPTPRPHTRWRHASGAACLAAIPLTAPTLGRAHPASHTRSPCRHTAPTLGRAHPALHPRLPALHTALPPWLRISLFADVLLAQTASWQVSHLTLFSHTAASPHSVKHTSHPCALWPTRRHHPPSAI